MPVMVCKLIYSTDQTQPNTKGFKQTPKAALMCLLLLGYKSSRYCTFEPIKVLSLPKKKKTSTGKKKQVYLTHM